MVWPQIVGPYPGRRSAIATLALGTIELRPLRLAIATIIASVVAARTSKYVEWQTGIRLEPFGLGLVVKLQIHLATVTCTGPLLPRRTTTCALSIRPTRLVLLDLDTAIDGLIGRKTLVGMGTLGSPTILHARLTPIADGVLE